MATFLKISIICYAFYLSFVYLDRSESISHTVLENQTLNEIATGYDTRMDTIVALNPQIKNPDLIRTGTSILITYSPSRFTSSTKKGIAYSLFFALSFVSYRRRIKRPRKLYGRLHPTKSPKIPSQRTRIEKQVISPEVYEQLVKKYKAALKEIGNLRQQIAATSQIENDSDCLTISLEEIDRIVAENKRKYG